MSVALVTGGVTGIGAATCDALKANGYVVVANYRGDHALAAAFQERTGIRALPWDVADAEGCVAGVARVDKEVGPVDVLINNAGVTADAMLHRMTVEQWREVISVNLDGCFYMCRAVMAGMGQRGYGRIVNVSSVNGQSGQLGQTNYAASKAGLLGLTKALALESASRGITVNAVAPGYTDTAMASAVPAAVLDKIVASVPIPRMAQPAEIARVIAFLCARESGYITGSTFSINGGLYRI